LNFGGDNMSKKIFDDTSENTIYIVDDASLLPHLLLSSSLNDDPSHTTFDALVGRLFLSSRAWSELPSRLGISLGDLIEKETRLNQQRVDIEKENSLVQEYMLSPTGDPSVLEKNISEVGLDTLLSGLSREDINFLQGLVYNMRKDRRAYVFGFMNIDEAIKFEETISRLSNNKNINLLSLYGIDVNMDFSQQGSDITAKIRLKSYGKKQDGETAIRPVYSTHTGKTMEDLRGMISVGFDDTYDSLGDELEILSRKKRILSFFAEKKDFVIDGKSLEPDNPLYIHLSALQRDFVSQGIIDTAYRIDLGQIARREVGASVNDSYNVRIFTENENLRSAVYSVNENNASKIKIKSVSKVKAPENYLS